ncbi:MAG: bifunctional alpha,alpha-trehalose-phosphate synthase (UDP-forming)/trehalose-phosphatase [Desulfobacteraceae bacterium]|nr:bifunctional alpha,alpha-trehalose-phosphate synthase (UDP-forming)/trehalose-phosphatase [Desulfobacteraceae bacterium]
MKTLINVSNRLPITIGDKITRSSGGLVSALEDLNETFQLKWVGWAGGNISDSSQKKKIAKEIRKAFNYYVIFLEEKDAVNYYNGYSNSSLWPLMHYMTTYSRYETEWFEAYQRVNHQFADAVIQQVRRGDQVWVHDYHLMLLPAILKDRSPDLKVGFFLHTPFPSSEVFRCHPNREELMNGLLGADLIGFQTFGYLRHFRSTVLRVLGIESEMQLIVCKNRKTALGVYPIGINAGKFSEELNSSVYAKHLADYQKVYKGKKIVLSVDRLDYTKGILQRLDAIEQFLSQYSHKDKILFIFISIPSRESVEAYQVLVDEVQGRVSQINGKYSTIKNVPLNYIQHSIGFSELCALYSLADACLVTPIIDGMNLVAKEYIACQKEKNGVLILSEFAGAAQELPNALIVNPYDPKQMVEQLNMALKMDEDEKRRRLEPMKERVFCYDAAYWAKVFLNDLSSQANSEVEMVNLQRISLKDIQPLIKAKRVALFLDYDGTLAELKKKPSDAKPNRAIKNLFAKLEHFPQTDVYITSGRKKEEMINWFGDYNFTLIAEHGFFYSLPRLKKWEAFDNSADLSWMEKIIEVFNHYFGMTPGSCVEVKTSSVVWHYRQSDPEFGTWKANQLVAELYEMLSNLPVEIHHGKKIVEVCSIHINKGMAMEYFINKNKYDMALCAGDDETDESMFRITGDRITSIKVGPGKTYAGFKVDSPAKFRQFLARLIEKRKGKNL